MQNPGGLANEREEEKDEDRNIEFRQLNHPPGYPWTEKKKAGLLNHLLMTCVNGTTDLSCRRLIGLG